jgi:pimeloyl-ACP methyl ester carboxylesterase
MQNNTQPHCVRVFFFVFSILTTALLRISHAESVHRCEPLLNGHGEPNRVIFNRSRELPPVNWNDPTSIFREVKRSLKVGKMASYYDPKMDTRIYYAATALPDDNGVIPIVDPDAKAVFIYFHGSGTMKSSGGNFAGNINTLASMGYSTVAFDYPLHMDGPIHQNKLEHAKYFAQWVRRLILKVKEAGKPIILVGHSYGPDVISEYIFRFPYDVDGALLMSPAGLDETLRKWHQEFTTRMKFGGGELLRNLPGGLWAGSVANSSTWKSGKLPDPTLVNPKLRVRLLTGDREEYVPAPIGGKNRTPIGPNTYSLAAVLRTFYSRLEDVLEPGVGHHLFNHLDQNGHNVVLRELLAMVNEKPENQDKLRDYVKSLLDRRSEAERVVYQFASDRNFRAWAEQEEKYTWKQFREIWHKHDNKQASLIMERYFSARFKRDRGLYKDLLRNFAKDNPLFPRNENVRRNFNNIMAKENAPVDTPLMMSYLEFLGGSDELED